jgi:hypothetical protein
MDVGVPVRVAYNQWTQFEDFPTFMKKVENVKQEAPEKTNWKAQIFWSHRQWEGTIIEQVPDQRIVWQSEGTKGSVDGSVSFHELAPDLTRIVLVLEYHPQGFFEKTGNIWRAQGRRARLELKHFVRHVMTRTILEQDQLEGWRGEIRDGEVVRDHETAVEEERRRAEEGDEDRDEGDEDRDRDEQYDEDEDDVGDQWDEGEEPEEAEDAEEPEDVGEPEEAEEERAEPEPRGRRPRSRTAPSRRPTRQRAR